MHNSICPLCLTSDIKLLNPWLCPHIPVYICKNCDHLFPAKSNYIPDEYLYDSNYVSYSSKMPNLQLTHTITRSKSRNFFRTNTPPPISRSSWNVIEIGCGTQPTYLSILPQDNINSVLLVEASSYARNYLIQTVDQNVTVFSSDDFSSLTTHPESPANLIIMEMVLEHLDSPQKILTQLKGQTTSDCIYRFTVPLFNPLIIRLLGNLYHDFHYPYHKQLFTLKSFSAFLLHKNGFEIISQHNHLVYHPYMQSICNLLLSPFTSRLYQLSPFAVNLVFFPLSLLHNLLFGPIRATFYCKRNSGSCKS